MTRPRTSFGGPNIYAFPSDCPDIVRGQEMFSVPYSGSGYVPRLLSANNILVPRITHSALEGAVFHPAFNRSGGEDTYFFRQLQASGQRSFWIENARVSELPPPDRCSLAWCLRRHRSSAANTARADLMLRGALPGIARQAACCAREMLSALVKLSAGDPLWRFRAEAVAGRVSGIMGHVPRHAMSQVDSAVPPTSLRRGTGA